MEPQQQQQHPARIQVSNTKKPVFFYVNLAKRFLQEHGEVQLSALGLAIPTMVTVAEILKHGQLAVEKKLFTSLDAVADDGRERAVQKPKMEIILNKSSEFDDLMAEASRQRPQQLKDGNEPASSGYPLRLDDLQPDENQEGLTAP